MGWQPGQAASRSGRGAIEAHVPSSRPSLLGIGAKPMAETTGDDKKGSKGKNGSSAGGGKSRREEMKFMPLIKQAREGSASGRSVSVLVLSKTSFHVTDIILSVYRHPYQLPMAPLLPLDDLPALLHLLLLLGTAKEIAHLVEIGIEKNDEAQGMTMTMTGGGGGPTTTTTGRARGETTTEGVLDTTTNDEAGVAGGKVIAIEGIEMSEMVLVAIEEGIDDAKRRKY